MDRNERILITGATGFIGGRLVEVLANRCARIRVATSDFRNCARVARFRVELVKGDLWDYGSLVHAAADCNVIFHFAYRFGGGLKEQQKVNLDGTRTLAEAFLKNGGRRFVHISSAAAYGEIDSGEITEETIARPSTEPYVNIKKKIEQMLLELHRKRGLAVTILQPTIVYGPYGSSFTTRILEQVRSSRIALPAGGICNAVYVDDVASAAILAAEQDVAVGERFLISGSSPTTWREFYAAYEKMLGKEAVIDLEDAQIQLEERRQRKSQSLSQRLRRTLANRPAIRKHLLDLPPQRWLLACGRRILPASTQAAITRGYESFWELPSDASETTSPLYVPHGFWRALYTARTHVRIDKARAKLGYNPTVDLDEGMARTAEWARWANLIPG
jgi:nucleoside-diphosphate-sugar epimerase